MMEMAMIHADANVSGGAVRLFRDDSEVNLPPTCIGENYNDEVPDNRG
jgi:hypothetical protein